MSDIELFNHAKRVIENGGELERETCRSLIEWLEAAERENAAQSDHINQQQDRIDSLEQKNASLGNALGTAERERDELRAEQAEHDEQIARMESKFSLAKRALDSKTVRCEKAEAELRRRDAAAGEPVAWLNDAYLGRGVLDGETGKEDQGPGYIPVYRVPPPAALSPEYHAAMKKLRHTLASCNRLNYCAEALQDVENSLALGAQQQKVVELHKRKSTEVISGQRYSYVLLEDLLPELDAAGVKWEVKK